jgi:hypothetical protein
LHTVEEPEFMSDQPPSSGEAAGEESRPKKGRTIDLKATEVKGADAGPETGSGPQPAQPPSLEAKPEPPGSSSQGENSAPSSASRLRKHIDWNAVIAGAAAGAAIAAAVVAVGLSMLRDPDVSGLGPRVSRMEEQLRQWSSGPAAKEADTSIVNGLADRITKLESATGAAGSAPVDVALADRVSRIERDLKALSDRTGMLAESSEHATSAAGEADRRAETAMAAVSEFARRVDAMQAVAGRDALASEVQSLTNRIAAAESAVAKARDASNRLAIVAMALNTAVDRGEAFASELTAAKSLAPDPSSLAPLEPFAASGIPTTGTLGRELLALMPSIRAAEPSRDGFLTRLQVNAEKLVRIRPSEEKEGGDAAAIATRIEVKAANADIVGALAEVAYLPPPMRAAARTWTEKAQARSAALESSQRFLAAALTSLSK